MRQVRPVEVRWQLFSLEEINKGDGEVDWNGGRSAPVLRVIALVRRKHGNDAVDKLYDTLAQQRFVSEKVYADEGVVEAALEAAGLDPTLKAQALADDSTREEVLNEHKEIVERLGSFGVPTIVLDDNTGPGMFGPVIRTVPKG